jgi:hypothetical protein
MANAFVNDDSFDVVHERILTRALERGRTRAADRRDELAAFQLVDSHQMPRGQNRIA